MSLNTFIPGLEEFAEDVAVETPVDAEQQVEIQQDIADAQQEATEVEHKLEQAEQLLGQLSMMHDHVQKYGVDRTFLAMFNANGELSRMVKYNIPSCESFDTADVNALSVACCEGISDTIKRFCLTIRDNYLKMLTPIRRAVQSWTSDAKSCKSKLIDLKNQLKKVDNIADNTIKGYTLASLKKWMGIKPEQLREHALDALHTIQSWSLKEANSDAATKLADSLEENIKTIDDAEPSKESISVSSWSKADLIKAIDYCIVACDSMIKTDEKYEGYWKTGFNQGKLQALLGETGDLVGIAMTTFRRNVIRIARTSWRNMNTLCSIDDTVIHAVIRMAEAAVK
jgi:hypothetical protein